MSHTVTMHADADGRRMLPAVNVKLLGYDFEPLREAAEAHVKSQGDDDPEHAQADSLLEYFTDRQTAAFWEHSLPNLAAELFGPSGVASAAGRSSGWVVVDMDFIPMFIPAVPAGDGAADDSTEPIPIPDPATIPEDYEPDLNDPHTWPPVLLARWERFARLVWEEIRHLLSVEQFEEWLADR